MSFKTSHFGLFENIDNIARAGFDVIELHAWEMVSLDEAAFKKGAAKLKDSGLDFKVVDNPLPLDIQVADESFNIKDWEDHLKLLADRTASLGGKYFMYGNGRTRSIPEAGDKAAAIHKNEDVLVRMSEITKAAGVNLLVEPLAFAVSNYLLSIKEVFECKNKLGLDNMYSLIDYRWFLDMNRPYEDITEYSDFIKHIHIDNPVHKFPKRLDPMLDDGVDYSKFFDKLKEIKYNGIIAIEANTFDDFDKDIAKGLAFLKKFRDAM